MLSYVKRKRVGSRVYLYEMESFRDADGNPRNRILRYLGPEEPVYGRPRGFPPALANLGQNRSPSERKQQREVDRRDAEVVRWLAKNRW